MRFNKGTDLGVSSRWRNTQTSLDFERSRFQPSNPAADSPFIQLKLAHSLLIALDEVVKRFRSLVSPSIIRSIRLEYIWFISDRCCLSSVFNSNRASAMSFFNFKLDLSEVCSRD
jgi:hypothetical protein